MRRICEDIGIKLGPKPLIDSDDYRYREQGNLSLAYGPTTFIGMPCMVISVEDNAGNIHPTVALVCQRDGVKVRVFLHSNLSDLLMGQQCWQCVRQLSRTAMDAVVMAVEQRVRRHNRSM